LNFVPQIRPILWRTHCIYSVMNFLISRWWLSLNGALLVKVVPHSVLLLVTELKLQVPINASTFLGAKCID
jgi:hypothetical protein